MNSLARARSNLSLTARLAPVCAKHSAINKRIVPERFKEFTQHRGLLRVFCHAIHFSLQLLGGDRPLPVILQRLRVAQIVFYLLLDLAPVTSPYRVAA